MTRNRFGLLERHVRRPLAVPLLSRFAPRLGLVTLRQTFVRRRHGGGNRPCGELEDAAKGGLQMNSEPNSYLSQKAPQWMRDMY
jgi:hypothetical protein